MLCSVPDRIMYGVASNLGLLCCKKSLVCWIWQVLILQAVEEHSKLTGVRLLLIYRVKSVRTPSTGNCNLNNNKYTCTQPF